jgi:hypothetical protein
MSVQTQVVRVITRFINPAHIIRIYLKQTAYRNCRHGDDSIRKQQNMKAGMERSAMTAACFGFSVIPLRFIPAFVFCFLSAIIFVYASQFNATIQESRGELSPSGNARRRTQMATDYAHFF